MTIQVPIQDIIIPDNRQRREFDEESIRLLADSIEDKGLLHPPVLRQDERTLTAGERRLRAIGLLHSSNRQFHCNGSVVPAGIVPCNTIANLTDYQVREAELEENILRVDLTMQERVRAVAELHSLRLEQNPKQTFNETASEIQGRPIRGGVHAAAVSDAVAISRHLDDPQVAKASSEKEALKIIRKKLTREIEEALAQTATAMPSPHIIECIHAINGLEMLEDACIDTIVTDPPYGIGADTFGDQGGVYQQHVYDDSFDSWVALMEDFAKEAFRVTKPQAHIYIFCDLRNFTILQAEMELAGWDVWPLPLIWFKGGNGILPRPDHGPRRTYEAILYAIKGNKPVTRVGMLDTISIPAITTNRRHAAEKPVALYENLLDRSSLPGDVVLDPFCGSGTIFPAASNLQLRAIGFENNQEVFNAAKVRMENGDD
ncbi:MAG: DNA methyltransferase [bacterium]